MNTIMKTIEGDAQPQNLERVSSLPLRSDDRPMTYAYLCRECGALMRPSTWYVNDKICNTCRFGRRV